MYRDHTPYLLLSFWGECFSLSSSNPEIFTNNTSSSQSFLICYNNNNNNINSRFSLQIGSLGQLRRLHHDKNDSAHSLRLLTCSVRMYKSYHRPSSNRVFIIMFVYVCFTSYYSFIQSYPPWRR